jgi:hypothetical protein
LHPFEIDVRGDDAAAFVEWFTPERALFEGVRTGDVWGYGGAGASGSMADKSPAHGDDLAGGSNVRDVSYFGAPVGDTR